MVRTRDSSDKLTMILLPDFSMIQNLHYQSCFPGLWALNHHQGITLGETARPVRDQGSKVRARGRRRKPARPVWQSDVVWWPLALEWAWPEVVRPWPDIHGTLQAPPEVARFANLPQAPQRARGGGPVTF